MIDNDDRKRPFFTPEFLLRVAFLAMGAALCTMFWIATNDNISPSEKGFQLVIGSSALAALAFFAGVGRSEGSRTRAEIRAMRAELAENRRAAGDQLADEFADWMRDHGQDVDRG